MKINVFDLHVNGNVPPWLVHRHSTAPSTCHCTMATYEGLLSAKSSEIFIRKGSIVALQYMAHLVSAVTFLFYSQ